VRQIVQNLRDGTTSVVVTPAPTPRPGEVLIGTALTLVSSGTERMLVDFGRGNLIAKVRQQPEKARLVLEKMRTDGVLPTLEAVRTKLDEPLPLGYCNVGRVIEPDADGTFGLGDRVVSNGPHAEVVRVPRNLCAKVPDAVTDEAAAFTVLGAIALQGVRLIAPTLGETVYVAGLGVIGLIAVQLLRANGCRVLAGDFDPERVRLAVLFGATGIDLSAAQDPVAVALDATGGHGVDAVLLAASTESSEPVSQAARMSRKRGRVVLVGVTGLELSRAEFYAKELTFQVSCSYGPGRYDPEYEQAGNDYPLGFVRWTEQRNFEAVLELMRTGAVRTEPLVTHRFDIASCEKAYELLAGGEPSLGILLQFHREQTPVAALSRTIDLGGAVPVSPGRAVSFIGAGNYATRFLLPAFRAAGADLGVLVTTGSVRGAVAARRFGFRAVSTELEQALGDAATGAIVIATRHSTHADLVCRALIAGKHVFVEKPIALSEAELERVMQCYRQVAAVRPVVLVVGYNRRFAPLVVKMRALLRARPGPKSFVYTINAGQIPPEHWTQNAADGGGRIVGEACHFIDLLRHLAGAPIAAAHAYALGGAAGALADTVAITLEFADGSLGTMQYFANGGRSFPKERLEVFAAGATLQLDNFRRLNGFNWPGFSKQRLWRQDKGQSGLVAAFAEAITGDGPQPMPVDEIEESTRIVIECARALVRAPTR
jgi:predicted dehydrogenase/threonine dehydrogenase-like Zn-dependent dehydrogenase